MNSSGHLWTVVLAGGDGSRVRGITRDALGRPCPKQFCRIGSDRTLVAEALERVSALTAAGRILAVVAESQRRWWVEELAGLPRQNVLPQPVNRGTAVAVLSALLTIRRRDPDAIILVVPSDHGIEEPEPMTRTLRAAVQAARQAPDRIVLIGVAPDMADPEYGWIVPARERSFGVRAVSRFVEKPPPDAAGRLARTGALVSSFMFAASVRALHHAYAEQHPELLARLQVLVDEGAGAGDGYASLPALDFSRDILERVLPRLLVVAAPECGWTDLGTPERLRRWLARAEPIAVPG